MLFNSLEFLFVFLPVTALSFFGLRALGWARLSLAWMVLASLLFYGWHEPTHILLILASVVGNFFLGQALAGGRRPRLLAFGIAANLAALAWYKYAGFLLDNASELLGSSFSIGSIALPLAISFFTFQQIAYLVDCHRGLVVEHDFGRYSLFVTFFPQLIAGPIVHHAEVLPQFSGRRRLEASDLAVGLSILILGLAKKVLLADSAAPYADSVFSAAETGATLTPLDAWGGLLAFHFQIYFDFSGYSDMAIGLARLFGIRLPENFRSPYKSTSIIDFWRTWHMTLSRFLRDYLYFALGGNRRGRARRYLNLFLVMLLGGLWHGASWTFVAWGGLHGVYLVVNHGWRHLSRQWHLRRFGGRPTRLLSIALTFFAAAVAWAPFRAETFHGARHLLRSAFGLEAAVLPEALSRTPISGVAEALGLGFGPAPYFAGAEQGLLLLLLWGICWLLPNTQTWLRDYAPALGAQGLASRLPAWRPVPAYALALSAVAVISVLHLTRVAEFIYFQF